jgi:aspartate/glutamate/glutamine transport system substrate-binding protein
MFKRIFWLLILIVFISSGCTMKKNNADLYKSVIKNDKIIVGISFDSKPFGFKDSDGKIKGLEADLAREIANRILGSEKKIVFKNIIPQERINAVKSGDVDMVISTMTITPQRKKLVDFSVPYFISGQVICVKKGSKIDSRYDLMNKKIIVILETTGEKNIKRFAPNALIQGYADNLEAINAFKNGSVDAITTDDALLEELAMENKDYIILPEKLTKEPYGIAFKKSKNTKSFKQIINEIIKDIKSDGTLQNIKYKWGID